MPPAASGAKIFTETGLFGALYSEAGPNGLAYTPGPTDPQAVVPSVRPLTVPSVALAIPSSAMQPASPFRPVPGLGWRYSQAWVRGG